MSSGFNGLPNIKMEDGGMGSLGLKVKHKTFNINHREPVTEMFWLSGDSLDIPSNNSPCLHDFSMDLFGCSAPAAQRQHTGNATSPAH